MILHAGRFCSHFAQLSIHNTVGATSKAQKANRRVKGGNRHSGNDRVWTVLIEFCIPRGRFLLT